MPNKLVVHVEGDSISQSAVWTGQLLRSSRAEGTFEIISNAIAGSRISGSAPSLLAREATSLAKFRAGAMNVLMIEIGANDFSTSNSATNDAAIAALLAYCDRARMRGFYVCLFTLLPNTSGSTFENNRTTYNPQIRAAVGVNIHACIDIAADSIMGPQAAASDTALFSDSTHPTSVGHGHMARIAAPVLDTFARAATGGFPIDKGAFGYDTRRFRIIFG